jgi:hypothetical protein
LRNIALAALLMLLPALGSAEEGAIRGTRPVSGVVSAVDPGARQLSLGAEQFVVPKGVYDLSTLSEGAHVIVYWEKRNGKRVVTRIDHSSDAD